MSETPNPNPAVDAWLGNLKRFGPAHSQWIIQHRDDADQDAPVGGIYYDLSYALEVCRVWTGDPAFAAGSDAANVVYRRYVDGPAGGVPPNSIFARGLAWQAARDNDWGTRATLARLAAMQYGAVGSDFRYVAWNDARNLGYMLDSLLYSRLLQPDPPPADQAARETHYQMGAALTMARLGQYVDDVNPPNGYAQPFMVGLATRALLDRHEWLRTRRYDPWDDPETLRVMRRVEAWLWSSCYRADGSAVTYADRTIPGTEAHTGASPDLSFMVLPLYGWLARETGDWRYLDRGNALFRAAVANTGNLDKAKQFSESLAGTEDFLVYTGQAPPGVRTVLSRVMAV